MTTRRARRASGLLAGGLALAMAAACGTTVPLSQQGGGGSGGGAPGSPAQLGSLPGDSGSLAGPAPADGSVPGAAAGTVPSGSGSGAVTGSGGVTGVPGAPRVGGAPAGAPGAVAGGQARGAAPAARGGGAGGTSTQRAGGGSQPGQQGVAAPGQAAKPAAAPTGPLKIGFVYYDASSSAAVNSAAGVKTSTSVTAKSVMEALIKFVNAHGGLAGRQVTLQSVPESNTSNDFSTDAAAACQQLTQDTPVPIVIDAAYGGSNGFDTCVTKAGLLDLALPEPPDAATLSGIPFEIAPQFLTLDRSYSAALTLLAGSGYLTGGSKLGVFMDSCPNTAAAYRNTILPTAKRLGLNPASVYTSSCLAGYGGLGKAGSDTASAVLQFRTAGVDRVMVVSSIAPTYWILFAQAADSQGYKPGYVMTSRAQPSVIAPNLPASQRPAIHGAGHVPVLDIDKPKLPGTAAEATCAQMAAAGGSGPSTTQDYYFVSLLCSPVLLLQAALKASGGDASAAALSRAIRSLGTSFQDPGVLGGASDFSHQDGPAQVAAFAYDNGCSCLVYTSGPSPA